MRMQETMTPRRAALGLLFSLGMAANLLAQSNFEAYYLFYGDHPANQTPGWVSGLTQGIGHDAGNWFITSHEWLWRVPVGIDLATVDSDTPGVQLVVMPEVLRNMGYDHFGDLDHFDYRGEGFVLIPVTHGGPPLVACFRSRNLDYVGSAVLEGQEGAGWLAISPQGTLYSSENHADSLRTYSVDWALLAQTGNLNLAPIAEQPWYDPDRTQITLPHMQGGEFSPSGELLFVVNGQTNTISPVGISVFKVDSWERVQQSTNGSGYFNYHRSFEHFNEPQGLTVWDLDDGRAPGIRGQLHVLLFDHDLVGDNDVFLKHYSNIVHVDRSVPAEWPEVGTAVSPFHSVSSAYQTYPIWDGAELAIVGGNYPEALTLDRKLKLVAIGGAVNIGK